MKKKIWACFFAGLFLNIYVFAQIDSKLADSLKGIDLSVLHDSLKLEVLNSIAIHSLNHDSILHYSLNMLDYTEHQDPVWQYRAYQSIGQAYSFKGKIGESLEYLFEAMEVAQSLSPTLRGLTNMSVANVYKRAEDLNKVLYHYKEAERYFLQSDTHIDSIYLTALYSNLGDHYFLLDSLDSAMYYSQKAKKLAGILDRKYYLAVINGNIGLIHASLGKDMEAEQEINESIDYLRSIDDLYSVSIYLTYMADIYAKRGKQTRALDYAHQALSTAESQDLKEQVRDASLKLSQLYKQSGNYRQAYEYQTKYIAFRDSINNEETIRKMADLRTQYEVGQKQTEVDLLTLESRTQSRMMIALWVIIGLVMAVVVVIYVFYRAKNRINMTLEKQKADLEELNQTKDRFFSIISHDLRGPISAFNGVSRMIKFLVVTKQPELLLELAEDIDQSVDRLSSLLDNLLNWALQQQGHFPNVPEKVYLRELIDDLVNTFSNMAKSKNIALNAEVSDQIALWADRNTTETILRNLVNNALKFTPEGGEVKVVASEQGEFAKIQVSDTGVGIPEEKMNALFKLHEKKSTYGTSGEKGLGLGLQLVHEFIEMNNGRISVMSRKNEGTTFMVHLPLFESQKIEA